MRTTLGVARLSVMLNEAALLQCLCAELLRGFSSRALPAFAAASAWSFRDLEILARRDGDHEKYEKHEHGVR